MQRGIYSAKFGYLGGIHITLMLSWVSKCIAHDFGSTTTADLVASFFHHFARFDWANDMMYDAFFHKKKPRYHRSAREPMVMLGFHTPNSNIAHTSTVPGLQTLTKEAKAADERLSDPTMTWDKFLGQLDDVRCASSLSSGASEFLEAHSSYVKIDIQFWGRTLAKGKGLVGWVESRCLSLVVGKCFGYEQHCGSINLRSQMSTKRLRISKCAYGLLASPIVTQTRAATTMAVTLLVSPKPPIPRNQTTTKTS